MHDYRVSETLVESWQRSQCPGPAFIKLFESENELKCKNCLHDFIETLCLF